jgi:hypothetical protein
VTNFNYGRKHFAVNGHYDYISPNFRIADTGFLATRVDKTNVNYGMNVIQPDPRGSFRNVNWFSYANQSWNHDQLVFENYVGSGVDLTFRNFWGGYVEVQRNFERYDDLDSRGGPPILKPANWGLWAGGHTDSRNTTQLSVNVNVLRDAEGGWAASVGPTLRVQPASQVQFSLSAQYQPGYDIAQWITNTDADGDGVTDYVYGRLRRNVVSLTMRGTYAFSRDMTLEAYIQPFVAVGDYSDIRKLAAPKSFEFEPVALTTNPDFNTKSLKSNVVYRWEYVKGSTLFVVWNMSRQDDARPGVFSPWRDIGDAFAGAGTHVFMVKVNYWLGL